MSWRGETEDGTGWGGLVPSKAEREAERAEVELRGRHERELREAWESGRDDGRAIVRAEVLRELLEWEAHYMQQARGGDQSGRSDARADAAREIHDHLRSSWETRELVAGNKPANVISTTP